jgi:hypothetical protein
LLAENSILINAAMRKQANPKAIVDKWLSETTVKGIAPEELNAAKTWVKINVKLDNKAVAKALKKTYGSGWAFGARDAKNKIYSEVGFDWDTWEAGNESAAVLVDAPRGLKTILDKNAITIKGIDDTTLDRIGSALANGLSQGLGAGEIANSIDYIIDDPARSMVIARTETARALVEASASEYRDNGITEVEWIVGEPCDICAENANQIMPLGEEFPSGDVQPPAHPNCICDISPVVRFGKEPEDDIELANNPELVKGNPDQPRDERGRFASTAGETQGGEAGRLLARDAIEAKIGEIKDNLAAKPSETLTSTDVPALVKDHVATTMAQSTAGKLLNEQLEQNPYAHVYTNSRDLSENDSFIDNDNVALLLNNTTGDVEIVTDKSAVEEMRGSDNFRLAETSEEKTQMLAYATANGMLAAWAMTSNDNNSNSLAMQQVAESHFGIQGAATWDYAGTETEDNAVDTVNRYEDVIAANLDAQYNATQQWFQEQGISEVTLYRGMEIDTPAGTQEVQMRPLSSWTLEPDQASAFGQTIFQATFPVDRILSIPTTGVGCLREQEAVVLGGRISAEVSIDDVMGDVDMEDMFDAVQNQMK